MSTSYSFMPDRTTVAEASREVDFTITRSGDLSAETLFASTVDGAANGVDGVVRGRRVDLQHVIEDRFAVTYHERTIGKLLKALGFSHISASPRHPKQDGEGIQAFKKLPAHARSPPRGRDAQEEDRDLVPRW